MALLKRVEGAPRAQWPKEQDIHPFAPGLAKLFNKPWWFRLWVVQEVLHATSKPLLGCGRAWISWGVVREAMVLGPRKGVGNAIPRNPAAILNFSLLSFRGPGDRGGRKLDDLLMATSDRQTALPHDKIFALLGLAAQEAVDDVPVDYGQSYSVIYQKAMVHVLQSLSNVNFLIHAMNPRASKDVPSWCVDFSKQNWNSYTITLGWRGELKDADDKGASKEHPKSMILHDPGHGTIKISGTVVGSIVHVQSVNCETSSLAKSLAKQRETTAHSHPQARELRERLFHLVVDDMITFTQATRTTLESRLSKAEVLQYIAAGTVWKTAAKGRPLLHRSLKNSYGYLLPNVYSALDKFAQQESAGYRSMAEEWSHLGTEFPNPQKVSLEY
ncbi:MAG: hypothetical protein Q9211_001285 [Gyalolechia sp. 1 TL-2023]